MCKHLKLWTECSEFLWTLNSEKCCDIKLQIHKTWNERTPHKEQSRSNSWLTIYLLARQNIFSHDEISSYSTMANHVRSPISVSIPEAVTQDGVTIYKIHVSLISLYIKISYNFCELIHMTDILIIHTRQFSIMFRCALVRSPMYNFIFSLSHDSLSLF